MKHLGTKRIETKRLVLRALRIEDAPAMYGNWANDAEVTKFLTWPPHESVEITKEVLAGWISQYQKSDYYQWAISLKDGKDEVIGTIGAVEKDDRIQMVNIGYCLGKSWWNQGIMSESLQAIIDFFFDEVGMNRIEARHDVSNPNSGKVMLGCGMKYEGTIRQADYNNQGICDCALYAKLASDE